VKDPWRIVDPLRSDPIEPANGRIDLADKDMDADLRPSRACMLRFRSCSLEIVGTDVHKPEDALARLARCVAALKKATASLPRAQRLLGAVYTQDDAPPRDVPAATLSCGRYAVAFSGMTLDQGTLVLARALMAAGRDTKLAPILQANGVTPMLRTT
jgi:hypothetical protein